MKLSELQPDTLYATRDGQLLKTGSEIRMAEYTLKSVKSPAKKVELPEFIEVKTPAKKAEDPWAPSGQRAWPYQRGLLVTMYAPGRDGQPEGEGQQFVLQPRDIAGTWELYLELHADEIEQRHIQNDARKEANAEHKRIVELLHNDRGMQRVRVNVRIMYTVTRNGGTAYSEYISKGDKVLSYAIAAEVTSPWTELEPQLKRIRKPKVES